MEVVATYILNHFFGLAANLNSDYILTAHKDQQAEELLQAAKARDALKAFRPMADDVRLACLQLAEHHEQLWVSPAQQLLRPLLRDPSFHQDFVEWLQVGAIEEGELVKARMIEKMEDLLASAEISPEQRQFLHDHFFDALDKAVFADDVLSRWRQELIIRYLIEQVVKGNRLAEEAAGKYSEARQAAALEAYCRQALASWDIIDLSNLPDDRDLATQQLLLRQLYMPLRIGFEAPQADRDDRDLLVGFEQRREAARLREAGRSGGTDSRAIDAMGEPVAIGERLGVGQRSVVLGDPGGGKTTMLRWLATAYLLRHSNDPAIHQLPDAHTLPAEDWIPVLIRCRDIGEADLCRSFKEVLAMHLNKTELQPQEAEVIQAVILDRLTRGKILLLVDGLDEISNRSVRQSFCQQLERTALRYPDAPILVTSRIVGYRDMPDRMRTGFAHGVISDLQPATKDLFASRWVAVTEAHKSEADRQKSAQDLIAALHSTDRIERLTGNPMLLTTMALVKRKVGKLPTRRNKLYGEAIAVLLNWNPKVYVEIEDEEALPQLAYLAYEMCRRGVQRLTGEEVLDLLEQLRADYPKIRALRQRDPQQFLQLLEERSGLLMRSGVQWQPNHSQEKAIWEFRHLTFQEYLAAQALNLGYFKGRDSSQPLAEQVAPLAAPVRQEDPAAHLNEEGVAAVPDSWREALRLLVSLCRDDDVDDVLLSILNPCAGEDVAKTQGPRAILAAQCLADEPNVGEDTALDVLKRFVALMGEDDGGAAPRSSIEMVALEVWCSHPDHRHALQNCLLEAFAEPANISSRHCGAVLAQLLGSTMPSTADGLEEILHTARANLDSPSDAEAILAALKVLEVAYQRWLLKAEALKAKALEDAALEDSALKDGALREEALEDQLLALLARGGAPAHAAAWALAWLGVDPVPATASPPPSSRNRLWPPLSSQHGGLATATGWRPSRQATAGLVRALRQAQVDEIDLKRHLVGLLGMASHADVLPPLLVRLDDPEASVRRAVQIALASLSSCVLPLSASCLSDLEAELTHRLLRNATLAEPERAEALVLLALFDREELLRQLLSDPNVPVLLRRCALECLGLLACRRGGGEHRRRIEAFLEEQLRAGALDLLVEGEEGWAEHDQRLPPLQGASRALQLAASAELPLLGSGPGRLVPMLTLSALQEGEALRIRTEVVRPAVWRLPLPEWPGEAPQQLELVVVEGGEYTIGSPVQEAGRDDYSQFLGDECEGVDVEAQRIVRPQRFALARHPLTQAQWQAVARLPRLQRNLNPTPGHFEPVDLWECFAQPGTLPVDSVSWNDCQEWLDRLNRWLVDQWSDLGGQEAAPQLALPGEGQWEVACRAGATTPFHFGDTLDTSWANYFGFFTYGSGRNGSFRQRPVPVGFFGLVNRWGLAELHGQLFEWCGDQWHLDPTGEGWPSAGLPWQGVDPALEALGSAQEELRLLRGGSWSLSPRYCRSAFRYLNRPVNADSDVGFRVVCLPQDASLNP